MDITFIGRSKRRDGCRGKPGKEKESKWSELSERDRGRGGRFVGVVFSILSTSLILLSKKVPFY